MTTRFAMLSGLSSLLALASACGNSGATPPAGTAASPAVGAAGVGAMMTPTTPVTPVGQAGTMATPTMPTPTGMTPTAAAGTGASATAGTGASATPGTGAMMPVATAGTGSPMAGAAGGAAMMPPVQGGDPRGKCTINSGYGDDKACLLPPAEGEGIQIHVGPSDYKNMADVSKYLMQPGEESSECWTFHTPNKEEVYYQTFELSGRAGTHHIINTMYSTPLTDGGFGPCADPGTGTNAAIIDNLPGASKAYMPRGIVAPENKNIGRMIPPNAASQADMHYFNFTDKAIVREFWMNVFSAKKEDITETAKQIRAMGGISWTFAPIPPGANETYAYECPIQGNGRILALLGHYHAHGKKFTASIRRAGTGMVEKVFEMYDYQDPAMFEYDSVQKNPAFTGTVAGATSGILEVKSGDVLMWDCHIVNDGDVGLTYTNQVKTGEMCNLWGSSLGIQQINCVLP